MNVNVGRNHSTTHLAALNSVRLSPRSKAIAASVTLALLLAPFSDPYRQFSLVWTRQSWRPKSLHGCGGAAHNHERPSRLYEFRVAQSLSGAVDKIRFPPWFKESQSHCRFTSILLNIHIILSDGWDGCHMSPLPVILFLFFDLEVISYSYRFARLDSYRYSIGIAGRYAAKARSPIVWTTLE